MYNSKKVFIVLLTVLLLAGLTFVISNHSFAGEGQMMYKLGEDYTIVDTSQDKSYDSYGKEITPEKGDDFYGQDSQHRGNQPHYVICDDEVVIDVTTGLMWQRKPGEKVTFDDTFKKAEDCRLQDFDDWRVPTIKELYSLINFTGSTGKSAKDSIPYIDTDYFEFTYGDESKGERHIDSQYWSATEYVSTTMNSDATVFGVNFADGRIKGYPKMTPGRPGNSKKSDKKMFVIFVRGSTDYGVNDFKDNDDGTITDQATKLMWSKADSKKGMNWEQAFTWVQEKNEKNYLGHNDWRLPNIKELQSIVDYTRSPKTTNSAAIDPIFEISKEKEGTYPFFWSSTTHLDGPKNQQGQAACYIAFGEARGWMKPPHGGNANLLDVHGAGAQRSDPKEGDPDDYPEGRGPQGDVIKINNYVRLVRDVGE
jgi:Protein of unknown function (DUF1566)